MNERIEQLAQQAGIHPVNFEPDADLAVPLTAFSELIINDCCQVLLKWKSEPFPFDEDLAVGLIKEHFGVKT